MTDKKATKAALLFSALTLVACSAMSYRDLLHLPQTLAHARIAYGPNAGQFGDLRLPPGPGPHPVIVLIHGGCWHSKYGLAYMNSLASALTQSGSATWNLEYRRLGNGGGWPNTFNDVAKGADHVRVLAERFPLDLHRIAVLGHSVGGQLALWLAGRSLISRESELFTPDPLSFRGVVALAPISDPQESHYGCGDATARIMGGGVTEQPLRYANTSPLELLPTRISLRLLHGENDTVVPLSMSTSFVSAIQRKGGDAELHVLEDSGHFELVSPESRAWHWVKSTALSILQP